MINVFKKRTRLYALTTSAFFFLQGVDASIANGDGVNACTVGSYKDYGSPLTSIVCQDGKEHLVKYATVMLKKNGDNAVAAGRVDFSNGDYVVKKEPTIIKLRNSALRNQVHLLNVREQGAEDRAVPGYGIYGSAVFASQDGVVELKDTWIHHFDTGLYALYGGKIVMENGGSYSANMGAEAESGSFIMLNNTQIHVVGQQWEDGEDEDGEDEDGEYEDGEYEDGNESVTGLRTTARSVIDMKRGEIIFPARGVVVSAESGGFIQLDNVSIKINESKSSNELEYTTSLLLIDEGFISLKNENLSLSDSIGVLLFGSDEESSHEGSSVSVPNSIQIDGPPSEFLASSDYANYLIPKILGQETEARNYETDFKLKAVVKSSTINLNGQTSIGIYFNNQFIDSQQNEESLVFLQETNFNVPDGVAVSSNNMKSSVLIDSGSTVSGKLFLHAESSSKVSVLVNDSIIKGPAYVQKGSQGKIFLFNGSEWHLTRRSEFGERSDSCEDSCISFLRLDDSAISFLPLQNDASQQDHNYQTFRIGNGDGTVYVASGNSHIHLRASVQANASAESQLSDRLLIHGNVSGQTKVHVSKVRQSGRDQQDQNPQGYKPQSISIIQVYGEAREDSFKLNDAYVTIDGSPYQYILRAYGPTSPSKMKYFDNKLVTSRQIWDYRLESKIEAANGTKEEPPLASEIVLAEYTISVPHFFNIDFDFENLNNFEVRKENEDGTGDVVSAGSTELNLRPVRPNSLGRADTDNTSHEEGENESSAITDPSSAALHTLTTEETVDGSERRETDRYILGGGFNYYSELETSDRDVSIFLLDNSSGELDDVGYNIVEGEGDITENVLIPPQTVILSSPQSITTESSMLARSDIDDSYVDLSPLDEISSIAETEGDTLSSTLAVPTTESPVSSSKPVVSSGGNQNVENFAATDVEIGASSEGERISSPESPVSEGTKPLVPPVLKEVSKAISTASERRDSTPKEEATRTLGRERILLLSENTNASAGTSPTVSINLSSASTERSKAVSSTQPVVSLGRSQVLPAVPVYNVVQEVVSSQCVETTKGNGAEKSEVAYSCSDGQSHTVQGQTLKTTDKTQHSMHAKNQDTVIKLERSTIIAADFSDSKNNVGFNTLQAVSAVLAENNAKVVLDKNSTIQSSVIGLEAQRSGAVEMIGGTVNAHYVGTLAGSGSSVNLKDTTINVTGNFAAAGLVSKAGQITMNTGAINLAKGVAVRSESGGSITLDKVDITVKKEAGTSDSAKVFGRAAFLLRNNASVDFKNGNVVTDGHALWVRKGDDMVETGTFRKRRSSEVRSAVNHANIEASTVKVEGDGTYGIYFDGLIQKEERKQNQSKNLATEKAGVVKRSVLPIQDMPIGITGTVSLKKTDFEVAKGIAIYGNNSTGHVSLENKTTLAGDLLLKAENNSNISVSADNSIVTGGVRVNKDSYAKLDLANKSEWILKRSVQKSLDASDAGCVDSCVSSVRLVNSAIDFRSSESGEKYQTLHIGNGKGIVYEAQGDAVIHLNARLNPHDPSDQQVTDRLIIHGDVSGKTKIHVRGDVGNVANSQANAKIAHSVSVIQIYGQAEKDSFQLDGNYVALRNSPYKYTLRAYSPEATLKQEHVQQKFVKDGGAFWNFRLENQYVKSAGSSALPDQFVRSVVPQVPTYLVLPNSVFHAGLMDINNQNKQLETLRMTSTGMVEVRENPALYLRGYGGSYRYASDLSALEYGYNGDLDYRGVEAGVLLQTIENTDSALSFGVMGTYGNLSLQPLNVEQSQKSAFDKWTATVYGSMQHNVGFYVDGLLSYGLFKGDVLTLARGKTATLKGNPLSVSVIGGQTIATGYKGFVFDPQVQVVYQHLQFNKARDIDNFDIEMGNLDQWVARVGGRLTKIPTGSEGVNAVAFYGKLYLAHGFGEKQSVHFNDAFKLGAFGSSLEAGVGFNAKLLPQFSLHADILYQHKLNKAGFSGASFSGGVRYQF
ncbi:autotransporter outer membrane beta-barrel domain-containing protein [Bartonella sp. B1098]|uniref:autotransporter outer membrane beta-barrel domain-containing protein n=1 Tax=Bartonella sp. B1098 TaxID=2911421 RepID=UPI0020C4662A|nr:autotransporter outer membrane beta-barrel domain-containing protein [Bartonella sp. B1098]